MTLALYAVLIGVAVGLLAGGSLSRLVERRLRFELALLPVAVVLAGLQAGIGRAWPEPIALTLWCGLMVVLAVVCVLNIRRSGIPLALLGVLMNLLVVVVNRGMPVAIGNVALAGGGEAAAASAVESSWLYVAMSPSTKFPFLADVIPLPGSAMHRGMMSLGDALLVFGIVLFILVAMLGAGPSE